jgi:membrane-bound serine protease (ClpP class)
VTNFFRRPLFAIGVLLIAAGALAACASAKEPGKVHVLTWKGDVNPVMARYLDRGISAAERANAPAVVIRLDTPGGLDSSMREIIQRIESSKVPVIVYVSPAGGRAASAGTFITMAANVAAMAPNTSIGAATPISSGGADIEGALGRKVTNDAVSYIRGIAELRGRNADWAEKAVREAASVNQNEAVSLNVVDLVATDVTDLLTKSDGRRVEVAGAAGDGPQSVTLKTAGVPTYENNRNVFESLLDLIATPDIAFLLLSLGSLALLTEFFHPTFVMGIFGAIALVMAYFSLGSLPTNWAGVGLIVFGFVLIAVDLFVAGHGILGIGGVVALILGGLILTGSSDVGFQVSRWLVIGIAAFIGAFFLLFVATLLRIRRMPSASLTTRLTGSTGMTRTRLDPSGYVVIRGERWEATAEEPPIEVDMPVIVTEVSGLKLRVKLDPAHKALAPPAPAALPAEIAESVTPEARA